MSEGGFLRTRAMPVSIMFRDSANYTSTAKFHVREGTSVEDCKSLIEKVTALQLGHVDSYTIGYHKTVFPQKQQVNKFAMGGSKWLITFDAKNAIGNRFNRRVTIPCADVQLNYPPSRAKQANLELPQWNDFMELFLRFCVSPEGWDIEQGSVKVEWRMHKWPPKGQQRRR
jgi:hypothetical protein